MSYQSHEYYLRRAIEISREARAAGNTLRSAFSEQGWGHCDGTGEY